MTRETENKAKMSIDVTFAVMFLLVMWCRGSAQLFFIFDLFFAFIKRFII